MTTMQSALHALNQALDSPRAEQGVALGNWRWIVRQRMAGVKDALSQETATAVEGWVVAREGSILRERNALVGRITALGPQVLEAPEVERVRIELKRLLADISHHLQRLRDLAYDEVELELGGSE